MMCRLICFTCNELVVTLLWFYCLQTNTLLFHKLSGKLPSALIVFLQLFASVVPFQSADSKNSDDECFYECFLFPIPTHILLPCVATLEFGVLRLFALFLSYHLLMALLNRLLRR